MLSESSRTGPIATRCSIVAHPVREEGEGQRMGGGEVQRRGFAVARLARVAAQMRRGCRISPAAPAPELLARRRSASRPWASAVEQRRCRPSLQRADAAAEGGLGDVARLSAAREKLPVSARATKSSSQASSMSCLSRIAADAIGISRTRRPAPNPAAPVAPETSLCVSSTSARRPCRSPRRSPTPISISRR